jgi:hypothetical protein
MHILFVLWKSKLQKRIKNCQIGAKTDVGI